MIPTPTIPLDRRGYVQGAACPHNHGGNSRLYPAPTRKRGEIFECAGCRSYFNLDETAALIREARSGVALSSTETA